MSVPKQVGLPYAEFKQAVLGTSTSNVQYSEGTVHGLQA